MATRTKSEKLVIIRDFRKDQAIGAIAGMSIITASNGREDGDAEKYAIYNRKWIDVYEFAMGINGKTSISIELYDAITVK